MSSWQCPFHDKLPAMTQSISLKVAMTITANNCQWVHESAWQPRHVAFAENCSCFSRLPLQGRSWFSTGSRGKNPVQSTGFFQSGRWVLERTEDQEIIAALSFEWEEGLYDCAWLHFYDRANHLSGEMNPALWIIEAIVQRVSPDSLVIHGKSIQSSLPGIGETKIVVVPTNVGFFKEAILRIDRESWKTYPAANVARKQLDWIRRQAARENRDQEFAKKPEKRPLLFRILMALSPRRRRRSSKMVHPLDRMRSRLT